MIPVKLAPEPPGFDASVRKPGKRWLAKRRIHGTRKLSPGQNLKPYWRQCLGDLHKSYAGVCAYASVYIERMTGGVSADHYIAKSRRAGLAYEWKNLRLACSTINGRKSDMETILDPIGLTKETFWLELVSGRIYPRPTLGKAARKRADDTLAALALDAPGWRETRARHYEDYCRGRYDVDFLRERSPFVWSEAKRQGLL